MIWSVVASFEEAAYYAMYKGKCQMILHTWSWASASSFVAWPWLQVLEMFSMLDQHRSLNFD